jgi:hypothetical protein
MVLPLCELYSVEYICLSDKTIFLSERMLNKDYYRKRSVEK